MKRKILELMRILMERTDENNALNAKQISSILDTEMGLSIDRKTIYADIELLRSFGMKIGQNTEGYFMEERTFDLAELKLLVDLVQSSRFITADKSEKLISKLETLTSRTKAGELQRQVFIYNRAKADNEMIYENVDVIHSAIFRNRRVKFHYAQWNVNKKLELRHAGRLYEASPWALTWSDDNYYLVAYDSHSGNIRHYRVDKMQDLSISDIAREGKEVFDGFDLPSFMRSTFGMFGGEERSIRLHCSASICGVILDRFGRDVIMVPDKDGGATARINVKVSPQFFGWLAGLGNGAQILAPQDVREQYENYLQEILEAYKERSKI